MIRLPSSLMRSIHVRDLFVAETWQIKEKKSGRVAKQFAKTFIKSQRKLCKVRQSAANRVENYFCAQLTANLLINHRQQSIISL